MKIIAIDNLRIYPTDLTVKNAFAGEIIPLNERILSIGDLHGNAIKLIHILRLFGVMTLQNAADYEVLLNIYDKETMCLTLNELERFKEILDQATINKPGLLIFIGDEFADRGSNDYFTALVLDKLHHSQVAYRIHLSNHGLIALEYITTHVRKTLGGPGQTQSLDNLIGLFAKFPTTESTFRAIFSDAYLKHLSLVGYTLKDKLTIYAHAPIDIYTIEKLAILFGVPIKWDTMDNIVGMIDRINEIALAAINSNTFFKCYINVSSYQRSAGATAHMQQYDFHSFFDRTDPSVSNPIYELLWNRQYETGAISGRLEHDDYLFVHGHIGKKMVPLAGYFNLDNCLGKPKEIRIDRQTGQPWIDPFTGRESYIPADDKGNLITTLRQVDPADRKGAYLSNSQKPIDLPLVVVVGYFSTASQWLADDGQSAAKIPRLDP